MLSPVVGKTYMLVLCGGGDRPIHELAGRTPLEAATTPALDELARRGTLGMVTVIDHGICPESDSGIMALLGYDPHHYYTGRGALEALGMRFMEPGENAVGCRINFASFDPTRGWLDRRTARDLSDGELQQLVAAIRDSDPLEDLDAEMSIVGFGRHRGIVCLRSLRELSAEISNTDPGFRREGPFGVAVATNEPRPLPCQPLDDTEAATWTAELVNRVDSVSASVLGHHQVNKERRTEGRYAANRLLFRDAGRTTPRMPLFVERFGRSLAMYGHAPSERGLCELLDGTWHDAGQVAGVPEADYYLALVNAVTLDAADIVLVRLKAPDEPSHDGDANAKRAAIERLDELFFGPLAARVSADDTLVVTCDHATPCEQRIHSADPVPVLVHDAAAPERAQRFCERDAARGDLAVHRASQLLHHLLVTSAVRLGAA